VSRRPSPRRKTPRREASAAAAEGTEGAVKLQKALAEQGLGSRREMEKWIESGRIEVNGAPAHLGQRVSSEDTIRVDGRKLHRSVQTAARVLIYNKPAGEVCTRKDPERRPTVFDQLPDPGRGRWISIGRLDIASSGLLLLTNDGALANTMMHPSTGLDREYAVRINGFLDDEAMVLVRSGIEDDGEILSFSDIQHYAGTGTNHWYHVALVEGKNREIRRVFEHLGYAVSRLKRVRFGPVVLPSRLRRGKYEDLSADDLNALYRLLGLPLPASSPRRVQAGQKSPPTVLIPYPELASRR